MKQLPYFLRQTMRGMRSAPLIQLAAVGAIAMGLLLVGLAVVVSFNVDQLTSKWGRGTQLTIYLKAGASKKQVAALSRLLSQRKEIAAVKAVSSKQARARLKESLGTRASLVDEIEADFLPASLEVRLSENVDHQRVKPLLAVIGAANAVEEIDYLGKWAERLGALVTLLRHGGFLIALIVALACLYIVASTIRLGVYARRDEIEIQKLVGATDGFVRTPFMLEGALQGIFGGLLAAGLLYLLFRGVAPDIEGVLSTILARIQFAFLSPLHLTIGIVGGALVGVAGSALAMGRYAEV